MPANSDSIWNTSEEETPVDRATAHVGIVCTQAMELKALLGSLDRCRRYADGTMQFTGGFLDQTLRVAVVQAGAGFAVHRKAAETLIREHSPAWVISAGFSSSLAADVPAGDLCLATSIVDTHGQTMAVKCPIPESDHSTLRQHVVTDTHPQTSDEKSRLADQFAAGAVDTVSLAVAQICESSKIPFLSIRAIVDDPTDNLPAVATKLIFEPSSVTRGGAAGRWISNRRQPANVRQWTERAATTGDRLSTYLLGVIRQLGAHVEQG